MYPGLNVSSSRKMGSFARTNEPPYTPSCVIAVSHLQATHSASPILPWLQGVKEGQMTPKNKALCSSPSPYQRFPDR